jgi:hypothetical protein
MLLKCKPLQGVLHVYGKRKKPILYWTSLLDHFHKLWLGFFFPNKFCHFFKKKKGIFWKKFPLVLINFAKILEILFQWQWFIRVYLCSITLCSINHKSLFGNFQILNLFTSFQGKEAWKGVFWDLCLFYFIFQHHIHVHILNPFFTNFHTFFFNKNKIQSNLTSIVELNLVEIQFNSTNLDSIQFEIYQFNSNCMWCHSIFSFEWNLVFTKSTHFFQSIAH